MKLVSGSLQVLLAVRDTVPKDQAIQRLMKLIRGHGKGERVIVEGRATDTDKERYIVSKTQYFRTEEGLIN